MEPLDPTYEDQPHLVLVFGKRRVGKTFLCAHLASRWPLAWVYCFNPKNDPKLRVFSSFDLNRPPPKASGCLWVIDELNMLCSPNSFAADWLEDAVLRGAHIGVSIVANVQRPQSIHRAFTSLWTEVYVGRITGDRDLDYCVRNFGEQCELARGLPPRKFLHVID